MRFEVIIDFWDWTSEILLMYVNGRNQMDKVFGLSNTLMDNSMLFLNLI